MIKYEIRQLVETIDKQWFETVMTIPYDKRLAAVPAQQEYEQLKSEHPDKYFELYRVELNEECLEFTNIHAQK